MSKTEINQLPLAITVSGSNDYLAIDHSNGDGTFTTKRVVPITIAGLAPVQTGTAIEFIVKGSPGHVLGTGLAGYLVAPYGGIINGYAMLADASGSIAVDIWRCSYAQFDAGVTHPVLADSICGGNLPAIVSDVKVQGAATGWITAFSPNDVLAYNVYSTSGTISQLTLSLNVTKTTVP